MALESDYGFHRKILADHAVANYAVRFQKAGCGWTDATSAQRDFHAESPFGYLYRFAHRIFRDSHSKARESDRFESPMSYIHAMSASTSYFFFRSLGGGTPSISQSEIHRVLPCMISLGILRVVASDRMKPDLPERPAKSANRSIPAPYSIWAVIGNGSSRTFPIHGPGGGGTIEEAARFKAKGKPVADTLIIRQYRRHRKGKHGPPI
jgi:hypothetical protein